MRKIDKIIIHCSATPEGEDFTVAQIRDWHKQRGFVDIGYHYVVYRDGSVHSGRPLSQIGAHCKGQNAHSVGVCYIGGCPPRTVKGWQNLDKDTRTPAQKNALRQLVADLRKQFPGAGVYGHYQFANKQCPSFKIEDL